jgi:hypothetical protein
VESSGIPNTRLPRVKKSQVKIFFTYSFNDRCIIHYQIISLNQKVNQAFYVEVLRMLCKTARGRMRELWLNHDFSITTALHLV